MAKLRAVPSTVLCRVHWHGPQSVTRCMLPVEQEHEHAHEPCHNPSCRDRQDPAPR